MIMMMMMMAMIDDDIELAPPRVRRAQKNLRICCTPPAWDGSPVLSKAVVC